jgi:hypothetical protein
MLDIKTAYSYSENILYGGNKLEGNREGNFNILGRKFCFREG